jgi:chitinase
MAFVCTLLLSFLFIHPDFARYSFSDGGPFYFQTSLSAAGFVGQGLTKVRYWYRQVALSQSTGSDRPPLSVIAYYSGNAVDIDKYDIEKLTHIIYSFALLKGNRVHVSPAAGVILKKLVSLKKRNPRLKVLLAFGGWGGCKPCSELFAVAEHRKAFAGSVSQVLQQYQLDGIDIDWEYPAIQGPVGHPFAPSDKQHFTELIKTVRAELGNTKEISLATGAFTEYLQQSLDWQAVAPLVNRLHLMTYDLVNRNSVITGHHAALYSTRRQKESTDNAVRYLDSLGIPRNKIVIGVACYSRVFAQADSTNNGLYQPCKFQGFVVYKAYPKVFSTYQCFWDDEAKAFFCYNAQKKLFATFDDKRSVQLKTKYAIDKKLNGIMFWELRQDVVNDGLLDVIHETIHK